MQSDEPLISTTHGEVRGHVLKACYGDEYYCFDGIPYAKPPLGELRFRAPVEAEPWIGVRDCTQIPNKCTQYNRYKGEIEGSEDCLYLNVYAKKLVSEAKLPVIAYVHGGAFSTGDASRTALGPDYFMMQEVVFVTIGYRLGALGFLQLRDPNLKVPGNAALKDIVLALKWIQKNIENFNGDSNKVTLCGHSTGSMMVNVLLLSDAIKGLIHNAILMSGYTIHIKPKPDLEYRLATHLGYKGAMNDAEIYKFLSNIEAAKLCVQNLSTPEERNKNFTPSIVFSMTVEPYEAEGAILLDDPINLLENSWSLKTVPLIIGCNSGENLHHYNLLKGNVHIFEQLKNQPEILLPKELSRIHSDVETKRNMAKKLFRVHYGIKEYSLENFQCTLDLMAYSFMYHTISRFARSRLAGSEKAPTYLYHFNFDSDIFNLYRFKLWGRQLRGVGHVADLPYLFWIPESFKLPRDSDEFKMIIRLTEAWTNFAATSNPNTECINHVNWEPLTDANLDNFKCLNFNNDVSVIDWPYAKTCNEIDLIYREAGARIY